ncbi:sperm-associated antigen 1 isoform 2-T2 [Glossophaga mutica]
MVKGLRTRSGEEGYYPELTEFCEKRLKGLAPQSRALRRDKPAATASSFTAGEWEEIDGDIKSWVSEIKKEENKIHSHETGTFPEKEENLPPVRGSNSCLHVAKEKCSKSRPAKKKIPRDYAEWDKFDVEKECSKIDEDGKEKTLINNKLHLSKIETRLDTAGLTEKEKDFLATREKEKGNEAFNSGDYEEAVKYYTRSLSVLPTVVAYNNRAQAELKLQNWNRAFQDCEKVLELEPGNVKALLRRATTYKHQNKLPEAVEDLSKVLDIEPDNELAKKALSEVERDLKNSASASKTQTKGKRMVIQEVETSEDESGKDSERKHEDGSGDKKAAERAGAARAAEPRAMGNIQKKLTGKSEAGKRPEKGAPRRSRTLGAGADKRGRPRAPATAAGANGHPGGGRGAPNPVVADSSPGSGAPPPAPAAPVGPSGLKSQGNELFKAGQFAEAALKYSAAIAQLETAGSGSADDLSILYSNRAACYLKEGNCSGCIQDCDRALELHPFSVKPLLRRAMAYETLEQYQKAYVDYKTVLQIDCGIQIANDSINRALCYLKLCQFEEAKQDCDQALQIDNGNVKAYYRRALAHKGLKDYEKSINDLNKVLLLDSNIVEAKTELEEVTRFLNVKDKTASFSKEKERRKIEIQEVSDGCDELEGPSKEVSPGCHALDKGDTRCGPPGHREKLPITKPNNAYEFGQVINAITSRRDEEACAHLLAITEPKDLPALLSNKLDGDVFFFLIQSLKNDLLDKDPSLVYQHLLCLSKAERFKMMLTLISKGQKEQLEQLIDGLSDTPNKHFTLEDVQALKRQYEL